MPEQVTLFRLVRASGGGRRSGYVFRLRLQVIARAKHLSTPLSPAKAKLTAPGITAAIINGRNPPQLTAKKLMRLTPQLPIDWAEQRKLLGFR